jgi:hypothetical protein
MVIAFMLPRFRGTFPAAVFLVVSSLVAITCTRVPLLAPTGSVITLTTSATALPVNGTTQLIAQVVEASGQAPHSGTTVTFTTSLGAVQPSQAETDTAGRAIVTFRAGDSNGTATITAISGGAGAPTTGTGGGAGTTTTSANVVKIAVGSAAVGRISVSANPTLLPSNGGTSVISTSVFDVNGNPLPGALVSYSTTAGALDATTVTADANGNASTVLHTVVTATVTAAVGAASTGTGTGTAPTPTTGTVIVNISGTPQVLITPPATAPTAGVASSYTFAITAAASNGSAIRDVFVTWGDGQSSDLGAVTGSQTVSHTYAAPGSYTISAKVTDSSGSVFPASTTVTVNAKLQPVVSLTAPTTTPTAGTDTTFTASVTAAANSGAVIQDVTIDFGDGSTQDLGATTGSSISIHHVFNPPAGSGTFVQTLRALDTNGGVGTATTSVFVQATAPLGVTISFTQTTVNTSNPLATFTATVTGLGNTVVNQYLWDFGDGTPTVTTTTNQVTHNYTHPATPPTLVVTVTITTSALPPKNTASGQTQITP